MRRWFVSLWAWFLSIAGLAAVARTRDLPRPHPPIIDMHVHALPAKGWPGGPSFICPGMDFAPFDPKEKWNPDRWWESCPRPLYPATTDKELLRGILAAMDRYNIVLAAASGPLEHVQRFREAAPKRFLPALNVAVADLGAPDALRELVRKGEIGILGELAPAVEGISPEDDVLDPYFALAEELDIPVALHVLSLQNVYLAPRNRAALNNPLLLEKILVRHPKLRIYVMHAGWPMLSEMISILALYPQVYVDVAAINWILPRKEFDRYLGALVEAGYGKRIMFGSDTAMWPQTLAIGIEAIDAAPYLTQDQKQDIFCRNAARFLRLNSSICQ
jgi:uncharacterized protein